MSVRVTWFLEMNFNLIAFQLPTTLWLVVVNTFNDERIVIIITIIISELDGTKTICYRMGDGEIFRFFFSNGVVYLSK